MNSTIKEVSQLHKSNFAKKDLNDEIEEFDIDTTSESEESIKDFSKSDMSNKKETLLYIFTRYERLQNICNEYKCKNYVLKYQIKSHEEKNYYKRLEFSNLIIDNKELKHKVGYYKNIMYILCITNMSMFLYIVFYPNVTFWKY